jgi:hypothetical protein
MTGTPATQRTAASPGQASGAAADNGTATTMELLFRAVGDVPWVSQQQDTPPAASMNELLAERIGRTQATNTAALATLGIRLDTPQVNTGPGTKPFWSPSLPTDAKTGQLVKPWPLHPAASPRVEQQPVRLHHAPPLTVDNEGPEQRAALEAALVHALHARTAQEFGAALKEVMHVTRRTQGDLIRRDGHTKQRWLSRSTVSRMVNGTTIGRHQEQVEAFIRACGGVDTYAKVWGFAWMQVRTAIRADRVAMADQRNVDGDAMDAEIADEAPAVPDLGYETGDPHSTDSSTAPAPDATAGAEGSPPKDDALLDVHVRVTRDHLLKAAPVLVAMGLLTAANGRLPSGRELVFTALLGAAGIALLTHMQCVAQAANDATPQGATPSSATTDDPHVYMTAPRRWVA